MFLLVPASSVKKINILHNSHTYLEFLNHSVMKLNSYVQNADGKAELYYRSDNYYRQLLIFKLKIYQL